MTDIAKENVSIEEVEETETETEGEERVGDRLTALIAVAILFSKGVSND